MDTKKLRSVSFGEKKIGTPLNSFLCSLNEKYKKICRAASQTFGSYYLPGVTGIPRDILLGLLQWVFYRMDAIPACQ